MALLDSKITEVVYPKSATDPDFEQYEFMLAWIGRKGEPYQYLFEDWNEFTANENQPLNEAGSTNVRTVVLDEVTTVTLTVNDISRNDLEVFKGLKSARFVYRLFKTSILPIAIISQSTEITGQKNRYNFSVSVQMPRPVLAT